MAETPQCRKFQGEGQIFLPGLRDFSAEHPDRCPCRDCVSGRKHELGPPDRLGGRQCYLCQRYYFDTKGARRHPCDGPVPRKVNRPTIRGGNSRPAPGSLMAQRHAASAAVIHALKKCNCHLGGPPNQWHPVHEVLMTFWLKLLDQADE